MDWKKLCNTIASNLANASGDGAVEELAGAVPVRALTSDANEALVVAFPSDANRARAVAAALGSAAFMTSSTMSPGGEIAN